MNTIAHLLQEYLVIQKSISLPQIGTLQLKYHPANFDKNAQTLHAYRYELVLLHEEDEANKNKLLLFLKNKFYKHENITQEAFIAFTQNILSAIKTSVFIWQDVGIFKMNRAKKISFEANMHLLNKVSNAYTAVPFKSTIDQPISLSTHNQLAEKTTRIGDVKTMLNEDTMSIKTNIIESNIADDNIANIGFKSIIANRFNKYKLQNNVGDNAMSRFYIETNHSKSVRTEFLNTELTERYNTFQKISIIVVLIVTILYLFFHLFLNDFSFHSYSN